MSRFFKDAPRKIRAQRRALLANPDKKAGEATGSEVRDLLHKKLDIPHQQIWVHDRKYFLPEKSNMRKIVKHDGAKRYRYRKEGNDCDNFAIILDGRVKEYCALADCKRGIAFGIVAGYFSFQSENHMVNVLIDEDHDVWFVEPQDGKFHSPQPTDKIYFISI